MPDDEFNIDDIDLGGDDSDSEDKEASLDDFFQPTDGASAEADEGPSIDDFFSPGGDEGQEPEAAQVAETQPMENLPMDPDQPMDELDADSFFDPEPAPSSAQAPMPEPITPGPAEAPPPMPPEGMEPGFADEAQAPRQKGFLARNWFFMVIGVLLVLAVGAGAFLVVGYLNQEGDKDKVAMTAEKPKPKPVQTKPKPPVKKPVPPTGSGMIETDAGKAKTPDGAQAAKPETDAYKGKAPEADKTDLASKDGSITLPVKKNDSDGADKPAGAAAMDAPGKKSPSDESKAKEPINKQPEKTAKKPEAKDADKTVASLSPPKKTEPAKKGEPVKIDTAAKKPKAPAGHKPVPSNRGDYAVQVGSYMLDSSKIEPEAKLDALGYSDRSYVPEYRRLKIFHVLVGKNLSGAQADEIMRKLEDMGYMPKIFDDPSGDRVLVYSYGSYSIAKKTMANVKKAGLGPVTIKSETKNVTLDQLRVGSFTKAQAQKALSDLKRNGFAGSIIVRD